MTAVPMRLLILFLYIRLACEILSRVYKWLRNPQGTSAASGQTQVDLART